MQESNSHNFDVGYFLKSCADLEQSYEVLLNEKKKSELKLNEVSKSLQEIKEKYEQEKKNNLEISLSISEQTDKLMKKQNYFEHYENVEKQNDDFKRKIEMLKREKEVEKQNMVDKIKVAEIKKQQEIEEYEKKIRENKNRFLKLESQIIELDLEISSKDKEIKKLSSILNDVQQKHEIKKLEYEQKIKNLIKENEETNRKNKEVVNDLINESNNLALNNLKNKLKLQQQEYNKLEEEYLNLKKSTNKTSNKKCISTEYTKNHNSKVSYKI
ncbi:conserved Plasmodium protein, unknown function [Plasmodium relictum]|uniref:Uncharacterized protein n=1 Tax=Plasmodium relictum TaxID=85471 RepID=A0A1J1H9V8_PLARL|nr:conserved Plasmodium protein, unknown function [Plasmodium relictum]CRH01592.1 conserved Plasmodium protein, unknown function [Plasmodium relictum]